jgi:hypothetical protein
MVSSPGGQFTIWNSEFGMPHGTTFNAEIAELAEQTGVLCGFREFCVDRRGWRQFQIPNSKF